MGPRGGRRYQLVCRDCGKVTDSYRYLREKAGECSYRPPGWEAAQIELAQTQWRRRAERVKRTAKLELAYDPANPAEAVELLMEKVLEMTRALGASSENRAKKRG